MRKLIAGNWKMNGLKRDLEEIAQLAESNVENCDVLICPPFTLLPLCIEGFAKSGLFFGGQDCHAQAFGAYTGDISAPMLKDAGAHYVITGHSERRHAYKETNAQVRAKAEAAISAGLIPIICVGETLSMREGGQAEMAVETQVNNSVPSTGEVVIAYEPVWAIGTGLNATAEDITDMHAHIRKILKSMRADAGSLRLLYGGSVKGKNAAEVLFCKNVDGALVGGASLKAKDFLEIIGAA
jgi:triosephosphate isomerase